MKLFFRYLDTKKYRILLFLFFAALFAVVFTLYRLPLAAFLYPVLLCTLFGAGFLLFDFSRVRRKHLAYERLLSLSAETLGTLPAPDTIGEEDSAAVIRHLLEELAESKAASEADYRTMVEYYTVWAHQIKTPLASMKLALRGEDSDLSRRLSSDLFRTQQYVDMVLAFLRLGSDSTDYVFREQDLDSIIRSSVRSFAPEFIGRKLTLTYEPVNTTVVTDEKWFAFLLEQLLSNALKYTQEGGIRIYLEPENVLCISDTGIGIAPEDLPRIFERGYTGQNGRIDREASGLGLYLCRRIADALNLGLSIDSAPGAGTTVRIRFPGERPLFE